MKGLSPRLVDTERGQGHMGARAGTGAGLLVLPRPRLHLHLCQLGCPSVWVRPAGQMYQPLSILRPHAAHGSVGAEATMTSQGFPAYTQGLLGGLAGRQSPPPLLSHTLALQGERFCFLWVQHILATALSHQPPRLFPKPVC